MCCQLYFNKTGFKKSEIGFLWVGKRLFDRVLEKFFMRQLTSTNFVEVFHLPHMRNKILDAWNRALKAGALGQPEGWDEEGGGNGFQDGGHMYIHGWFMSIYGKNHYNAIK